MSTVDLLRRALDEIMRQREELAVLRAGAGTRSAEPIAIVGMGCRFPGGADSPAAYWSLLDRAADGTREVPPARWTIDDASAAGPARRGTSRVRRGGFLATIDTFDATFFGISPREARAMDPQQRLLLETAWHAIENAGIAPTSLYGSATGVFVGVTCFDHAMRVGAHMELLGPYAGTGSALNMIPGRLSFLLGLRGPSLAVDTACSSSLVALHLACQSVRLGECEQALVGGVHLMLSPDVMTSFAQAHMLSPDGWCKTFDARADGYARGEGCGVVVLKRLSRALEAGDRILGVIRGSAVNQDGPSGGLTVPSGPAQQAVMQQALAQAGLTPDAVDYVEAHGTGTALGDPIEIDALSATYGAARAAGDPLLVGSVKTNIGHLEPAAGMAALLKVLLSFAHDRIPMHRHVTVLNPHLAWDVLGVAVVTAARPWPTRGHAPTAGISAFGFSGTNAHVIVESPPSRAATTTAALAASAPQLLCLSAKSEEALERLAAAWQEQLAQMPATGFAAACSTARAGRAHFTHRLALVARTPSEAVVTLSAWKRGDAGRYAYGAVRDAAYSAPVMTASAAARAILATPGAPMDDAVLHAVAAAYAAGAEIDWRATHWPRADVPVDIPLYPFTPERHWLDLPTEHAPERPATTELASYRVEWIPEHETDAHPEAARPLAGRCLTIVGDDADLVPQLMAVAVIGGATIRRDAPMPLPGDGTSGVRSTDYILLPGSRRGVHAAPHDLHGDGVVELLGIAQTVVANGQAGEPHGAARCWVVTRDVAAVQGATVQGTTMSPTGPAMIDAARAAAARVLALEHPEHFGRVMDLPAHMEAGRAAELILRELQRDSVDEVVGYRGEQRLVPRLRPVVVDTAGDVAGVMRRDRSYLITGGFGALGMQVATALAKAGAGRLLLIGRRGPDAAAMAELVQALASYGTTVVPIRADVTDERAMREAIATHDDPAQPLAGVFHAAGVGGVRPLRDLVEEDVRAVLHPKLRGAWVLHEVTQHRALDHFVLFSSIAGVWGSRGQFHYAAANASLDALAEYRRARGLPGLAISWGPWEGKGMTSPDAAALLLRLGVQALPGDAATSWLLHALSAPHAHLIAAAMDWPRFRGSYEARGPKGLFSELPGATLPAPVGRDDTASRWVESITQALPTQRTRLVRDAMIEAVREVLGWGPTTVVPVDQGLFELGVDSLAALDLRTHLEHLLGTALPATLVFEYPTIDALTQFVEGVLTATPGLPPDTPMAAPLTSLPLTALVDTLTDDEADMLLRQTLETLNLPT